MRQCERHPEGPGHNCTYVDWRNSLVPIAVAMADTECPEPAGVTRFGLFSWSMKWDNAFHRSMARLTGEPFTRMAMA